MPFSVIRLIKGVSWLYLGECTLSMCLLSSACHCKSSIFSSCLYEMWVTYDSRRKQTPYDKIILLFINKVVVTWEIIKWKWKQQSKKNRRSKFIFASQLNNDNSLLKPSSSFVFKWSYKCICIFMLLVSSPKWEGLVGCGSGKRAFPFRLQINPNSPQVRSHR